MSDDYKWRYDLEEYIKQGEPERVEKSYAWQTAIGLQDVDGLKTSDYLLVTAKEHIEGKISIETAKSRIQSYYKQCDKRTEVECPTEEADTVSVRIAELLSEKTFQFSPAELCSIHKRLFSGIIKNAGQYRTYNITKNEWVLNGKTVYYASYDSIKDTLEYYFEQEKLFSYQGISAEDAIKHISKFTSGIWQIHPFCEGNTRTTAVFTIKYLKTFGFNISNDVFANNSWYFRNALVRANYNDLTNSVHATTAFLDKFFDNLIMNGTHDLKNRFLHIDYDKVQSANKSVSKCKNCTLEEMAIIKIMKDDPTATQKIIAELTGKSERWVKSRTVQMQKKGLIARENGKRNGKWVVLVDE